MIPLPQKPSIIKKEPNVAEFEIEGLYPGYGITIGNALRRVLLSSLPGAAITQINIKNVSHEFSAIPHVLEDVVEIILNLKQIRFKLHGDEAQTASIKVSGENKVKAASIKTPAQLEVMNKEAHIATITDKKGDFEMEIQIERGLGYVPVEQRKKDKLPIGSIAIDAIFSPVKKVNFEVENMRVGERTDYNRLKILIETDGSIAPEEALSKACEILIGHYEIIKPEFVKESKKEAKKEKEGKAAKESEEEVSQIKIEDLKFSTRTINALQNGGIKTLGGLARKSEKDLSELEGLGDKGMKEIKKVLKKYGFELKIE